MRLRPPRSTRTDTLVPYTTLFRSGSWGQMGAEAYLPGSSTLAEYQYLASMGYGSYVIADQVAQSLIENNVPNLNFGRSEERRVGKECVSTCRSRWSPYHSKKHKHKSIVHTISLPSQQQNR